MNKREYFARAEEEVKRAKQRLPKYAGGCSECKWSRDDGCELTCDHPAVVCVAFNITDAIAKKYIQGCDEQRDQSSIWGPVVCGPDGALFEKREEREPWWLRIFGIRGSNEPSTPVDSST